MDYDNIMVFQKPCDDAVKKPAPRYIGQDFSISKITGRGGADCANSTPVLHQNLDLLRSAILQTVQNQYLKKGDKK
jgi:hypothetical protein